MVRDQISVTPKTTTGSSLTLQIGDTSDSWNQLQVSVEDMHCAALGIADVDISTQDGAQDAVDVIKKAINSVSMTRGTLGATQNRLEHTQNNLSVMTENITDAESTIRDTDVAEEDVLHQEQHPDSVRSGHAGPGQSGASGCAAAAAVMPVTADHIFPAASHPGRAAVRPISPACPVGSGGAGRALLPQAQKTPGVARMCTNADKFKRKNSPKPKPEIRLKAPIRARRMAGFVPSLKFLSWKDEPILFR